MRQKIAYIALVISTSCLITAVLAATNGDKGYMSACYILWLAFGMLFGVLNRRKNKRL